MIALAPTIATIGGLIGSLAVLDADFKHSPLCLPP